MRLILISFIAASAAAQIPRTYLPAQGSNIPSGFQPQGSNGAGSYQAQGSFSQSPQSSQSSNFVALGGSSDTGNRRPQQEVEKNAVILKLDQDANLNGEYHYSYETSNGIRAEEAGNTVNAQGGFSYKGDDGKTYTITYTAGEGGFQPQGDHIPLPPPIPEEILVALQKNAKDEAAGIFDDGKYKPEQHGGGGFRGSGYLSGAASSGSSSGQSIGSSSSKFLSSSTGQNFGSSNHQGSFNPNSGYQY